MRFKRPLVLALTAFLLALAILAVAITVGSDSVRWRVRVVALKLQGGVAELSWSEVLTMMRQRRGYGLEALVDGVSVHGAVVNPFVSDQDVRTGAELFRLHCATCHGADGQGGTGPSLAQVSFSHGSSDLSLFRAVTRGIPRTAMVGADVTEVEAWRLVAFVRTLQVNAPRRDPVFADFEIVTDERLRMAARDAASWLTYSGTYSGQRHSGLDVISDQTLSTLRLKWVYQFDSGDEPVETTPIVVGGVMYVTEPPNKVIALDVSTGRLIWTFSRELPDGLSLTNFRANRGVAVYGDRVYVGTLDAHLVALDVKTGLVAWDVEIASHSDAYSMTGAPLAVAGKVVVGVSGGDFGARGFVEARDAATGSQLWRFDTVPAPGQPGNHTWEGDSWRTGGGATWLTGSYDPELKLIYWGVGNPAPDFNGDVRLGDNLYTCSVIALDADTGQLRWHFQFTPHDEHDWDSNQIPVLADLQLDGTVRKVLLWANRNGFYDVLDRTTGQFLHGRPFVKVTWASGLTATGQPIVKRGQPIETGSVVWPSVVGGTNWWSPSYSPTTKLFYVGAIENAGMFSKAKEATWRSGQFFLGGTTQTLATPRTFVRALRAETGEMAWEYQFEPADQPWTSGVLSTAGNIVFAGGSGSKGLFVALDAESGRELWRSRLGGVIHAGPISFLNGGKQLVTVAAGGNLFTFESGPSE